MRDRSTEGITRDRGFTLVEILIAIVLTGTLGAIVALSIGRLTDDAAHATCASSSDAARVAVNSYFVREGAYPTSFIDLVTADPGSEADLHEPAESTVAALTVTTPNWTMSMSAAAPPTFTCLIGAPGATSTTTTTTTTSSTIPTTPTTSSTSITAANGVAVSVSSNYGHPYLGESIVVLTNASAITAMTATIRIAETTDVAYHGQYDSFDADTVASSSQTANGFVTYTFTLLPGCTISSGSWTLDAQTTGTDSVRPTVDDTWSVTTTSGGQTSTLSGSF